MPNKIAHLFAAVMFSAAVISYAADKPKAAAPAAAVDPYAEVQPATESLDIGMYQRIRDEGLNHSHVMEFADALTNGIGPLKSTSGVATWRNGAIARSPSANGPLCAPARITPG